MNKNQTFILAVVALFATLMSVSCTKEAIKPVAPIKTDIYQNLVRIWEMRTSPQWHDAVEQYASQNGYTLQSDSVQGGFQTRTYLSHSVTAIYVLSTFDLNDTLWSLQCSLYSPRQQWLQTLTATYEEALYNRHPDDYTGGSFYWYIGLNSVDGGDVRTHSLFSQRVAEHPNDVWEWVEARTRYGLTPPYLGEDQIYLHTDGTRHYLSQLGLDTIPPGITHHLDIMFNTYDTTGWFNPWWF